MAAAFPVASGNWLIWHASSTEARRHWPSSMCVGESAISTAIEAAKGHGTFIYFQFSKVTEAVNVDAFKRAISDALGPDLLFQGLSGSEPVLHWLANKSAEFRNWSSFSTNSPTSRAGPTSCRP